jgi:hypothetical protein
MTPQPFYTLQRRSFNESCLMFGFVPEPGRGAYTQAHGQLVTWLDHVTDAEYDPQ